MNTLFTLKNYPVSSALNELDNFVNEVMGSGLSPAGKIFGYPAVDIREEKERFVVDVELPGFSEKEIDVKMKDRVLTIIASRMAEAGGEKENEYLVRERRSAGYERSFAMPRNIDQEHVSASYMNGVLSVLLPKNPEVPEKSVEIKVA